MQFDHIIEDKVLKGDIHRHPKKDDHALGFANQRRILIRNCVIQAKGVSEALKLSRCWMVYVVGCEIYGGKEDCVDIVRGGKIFLYKNILHSRSLGPKTKSFFTIKGGAHTVVIKNNTFIGEVSGPIIDLGNWTNYDIVKRPKVRHIFIEDNLFKDTKKQPLYRRIHSEYPECNNNTGDQSHGKVMRWPIRAVFWWLRRRGFLGGKVKVDAANLVVSEEENTVNEKLNLYKQFVLDATSQITDTKGS